MSRIGKKPIPLPDKVKVSVAAGNEITVTGPRGELTAQFPREIGVEVQEQEICVTRPTDSGRHRALHGLVRSLVANMITGVSEGFQKRLEIQGVGYRAEMDGKRLRLRLGGGERQKRYGHHDRTPAEVNFPHRIRSSPLR